MKKTPAFLFSTSDKVEIRANSKQKHPVKLIFSAQNEILGENFSRAEEKNTPKKVEFAPMRPNRAKKGGFGVEITGRGWSEKSSFTADFAMLWSSKMSANEFFSHFFSSKSCREWRNALPLHSQSGSNALARESYALNATRQQKCCCDLWKSYITDCREVQGTIDHEAFFLSGKKLLRVKWIVPSNSTPKQNKGYRNLSDKNRKQTNIIFTMKSLILAQDER